MENIIELVEKSIADEQSNIDYHTKKLNEATEKKEKLEAELAQLKRIHFSD